MDEIQPPFFRALFDTAADAFLVVDEQGRIALTNDACHKLLGYSRAELAGQPVELLVPQRFPGHTQERAGFMARPRPRAMGQGLVLYARHKDGRDVPVDIALTPLIGEGQRWTSAAIRDLTGRAQGVDALRVQATALRSAANGVVITDHTGTITWVNPAACTITGYTADELVGQHTRILRSGEHDTTFYATLWGQVLRGETWTGTIVNRRKDGVLYHEEQTIAPVLDGAGQVSHFIAIKQDVSARRRSEEALSLAHTELAARVTEIESLNRQLREQALRDPLTNLHNRRYFEESIVREVARAIRLNDPLAILTIDIDHFKRINDAHGHAAGDRVLQSLGRVISEGVRAFDLPCRFGGDEFVVALPGATLAVAFERAERWRARFADFKIEESSRSDDRFTLSIGVAMFGGPGDTLEATLQRADAALYAAKRDGRNRVNAAADVRSAPAR